MKASRHCRRFHTIHACPTIKHPNSRMVRCSCESLCSWRCPAAKKISNTWGNTMAKAPEINAKIAWKVNTLSVFRFNAGGSNSIPSMVGTLFGSWDGCVLGVNVIVANVALGPLQLPTTRIHCCCCCCCSCSRLLLLLLCRYWVRVRLFQLRIACVSMCLLMLHSLWSVGIGRLMQQ